MTPLPSLLGKRFLTFNSYIRVNQIEARRDRDAGFDEAALHTPENVRAQREALTDGFPGGRMTWCLSWQALFDNRDNYREIRRLVVDYHHRFGDDITFIPGGFFPVMYNTRDEINRDLHDAIARITELVGDGYRPRSIVAGYLGAESLRYLAEQEDIHVCQGNIWSQYAVDNGDGDGSISYPYYPSREHFCKPAQGPADFIDCVNLDGWTCDFISARLVGHNAEYNSRLGLGPIETVLAHGAERGIYQMLSTMATHFDIGFRLNGFGWATTLWEVSILNYEHITPWLRQVRERWPDTQLVTIGEFGLAWREHFKDNAKLDYRFVQRGSGMPGSAEELEIRWFMNRDFRLALLRNWKTNQPEEVIDFTRYDLPAAEPAGFQRNWSLMNRLNQKQTRPQDKPVPFSSLTEEERAFILRRCPSLAAISS